MNSRQLAERYLRYLYPAGTDIVISDNAPLPFYNLWQSTALTADPHMIRNELMAIAGTAVPFNLDMQQLLAWYAKYPAAANHCDRILSGRQPPKFFQTLLQQGYLAECETVRGALRGFFRDQLNQFD